MVQDTINLLGLKATDKVSGVTGTITSVCFDLYGCVCAVVSQEANKEGKVEESKWYDVQRLEVSKKRVMDVPHFEAVARKPSEYTRGAAEKPVR